MPDTLADLLHLFTQVVVPERRSDAARELARYLGAKEVIVFIPDPETGTLVPAPGFPQTLPGRRAWRHFLGGCAEAGVCEGYVAYPDGEAKTRATGVMGEDGSVLVAVGGEPDRERTEEAARYLPLAAATLRGEQAARVAAGREEAMRETASQLSTMARALDVARIELQGALQAASAANERMEHELAERRRVEEMLRRQTMLLQTITDNATTGLVMMDAEGRGTVWNRAAEEMLGFTAEEAIGSVLHHLFHHHYPDGRPFPIEECPIDRALPEGLDVRGYEDVFIRKDGTYFPVLCSARPILEDGTPVGTVIEVRDVTAEKQAEASLRESERRYRLAARATNDAVWDWDLQAGTLEWNEALGTLFGYHVEAERGTSVTWWEERIHPEDRERVVTGIGDYIEGNREIWQAEYRFRRADGSYAFVYDRGYLLRRPDGPPQRMIGALLDLTERKQIEESLREQTRILETINRVNARLAAELDLDRLIQTVTDAGTELSGAQFGAFFYNMFDERGEAYLLYTLSGVPLEAFSNFPMPRKTKIFGPTFDGYGIVRSDDVTKDPRYGHNPPYRGMPEGHLPVRSYLAVPVLARSGDVIGGLFFGHEEVGVFDERAEQIAASIADQASIAIENARLYRTLQVELGERQRAEARLQELNETLELRVARRTAELERANEALRKSNRDLQGFAYVASHDLQEPLRKVATFSNLLQLDFADRLDEEGLDYLERIESASVRMSQLLNDLLSFSRVNTHLQAFQSVDLSKTMETVLSDLEVSLQETAGEVVVGPLPKIEADSSQMHQLLLNLVGNALKYHQPDVPPVVRVVGRTEAQTGLCHLEIRDNGIGFDEKYLDRIFAPFQRLHGKDSAYRGSGMGLAICRRIVEHHNGAITARSVPGEGSTFIVTLPCRQTLQPRMTLEDEVS